LEEVEFCPKNVVVRESSPGPALMLMDCVRFALKLVVSRKMTSFPDPVSTDIELTWLMS
jgi:hypothetical protein